MTLAIEEIESAWDAYKAQKVIRGLKDGKEVFIYLEGKRIDTKGMLNVQTVALQTVISFPEYLRTKWK